MRLPLAGILSAGRPDDRMGYSNLYGRPILSGDEGRRKRRRCNDSGSIVKNV
ncbi:MAG: hypothetical protein M1434_15555 [Chloroflexi bacterium]|nr:hypothetical protein [Chloroflexota bacterium]MCL5276135.1 hypothetical protein [Chloroflexota bacterium]